MKAQGNVRNTDTNRAGAAATAASGGRMTFTKAGGLGKVMVNNLDGVVKNYERQVAEDRKAAARQRAAERAAEREANALANLDSLLDQIQG